MQAKRIFIVNQADSSQKYGVGRYIDEIIGEAELVNNIEIVLVLIGVTETQILKKKINNITYLEIPTPFYYENKIHGLTYFYSLAVFTLLDSIFDINKNDIFHFNSNVQFFLVEFIKTRTKSRIIYTIHISLWKTYYNNNFTSFISDFKSKECKSNYKKFIKIEIQNCIYSDKVVCLSDSMKQDVLNIYNITNKKVQLIPNGIKENKLNSIELKKAESIKDKLRINKGDFIFIYTGRITYKKGVEILIKVFKSLLIEGYKNIKLLIIGDGELYNKIKEDCKEFSRHIIIIGYVEPKEIKLYYNISNAFIFPSLNEQSSYSMLEAMSYKIPMIVTESDIFKKLINEYTCLKIGLDKNRELDQASFKEKIKIMFENEFIRNKITNNAYKLFIDEFSSKKMFDKTYLI